MTGDHAAGPTGRVERRPLAWRIGTPLVVLLSGALFAVSAADSGGTDLRPGRYTDLPSLAEAERADFERLQRERAGLNEEVDRLTGAVSGGDVRRLQTRATELKDPAGLTPRSGPGIKVTLFDAPEDVFEAAANSDDEDINLNDLLVHQQDIQAVVNAMWAGGAVAVTIAGQRVVSTTGIQCEGSVVQVQNVPYPQPFVIKAVGDAEEIRAAVESDSWVAGYMRAAGNPQIAVGWQLDELDHIEAPAFTGVVDTQYAKPID